jgi:transcriptional regulator GlxA family with amidase domain
MENKQYKVGILLFNEAEVLDFAGPFEVFSITTYPGSPEKLFSVSTISENGEIIKARNGLKVKPDYSFVNAPGFDILIVPGGHGAEEIEIYNGKLLNWLVDRSKKVDILASVCTGAFLLAKANLLDGKEATTHWMDIDKLEREYPKIHVKRDTKFVDQGSIMTAGGISAGINMSLYIISKLVNVEVARYTAKRMEYDIVI